MSEKNVAENLLDAAKAKLNEGVDRVKAIGHDVAASQSDNPLDSVSEKLKGVADRAKAEVHNAVAHHEANEADKKI